MREDYRFMAELPDDTDGVLRKAREFYPEYSQPEPRSQEVFHALTSMINTYPAPPEGLAKVYRALATLDNVGVVDHTVRDMAGREAIALYDTSLYDKRKGRTERRDEILVDPETFTYLGRRYVSVVDHVQRVGSTPVGKWKAGEIIVDSADEETALVDRKGQKP